MNDDHIRARVKEVKKRLDWASTTASAQAWWQAFEQENQHRLALVLRPTEELANRNATITEFFLAYCHANTDNIQAVLSYLDYTRLREDEKRMRRAQRGITTTTE
jgi:hypothetical protein